MYNQVAMLDRLQIQAEPFLGDLLFNDTLRNSYLEDNLGKCQTPDRFRMI